MDSTRLSLEMSTHRLAQGQPACTEEPLHALIKHVGSRGSDYFHRPSCKGRHETKEGKKTSITERRKLLFLGRLKRSLPLLL